MAVRPPRYPEDSPAALPAGLCKRETSRDLGIGSRRAILQRHDATSYHTGLGVGADWLRRAVLRQAVVHETNRHMSQRDLTKERHEWQRVEGEGEGGRHLSTMVC